MAVQFHLAHSTTVTGAAIVAAGPWDCAQGSTWRALNNCMNPPPWASPPTAADSRKRAVSVARAGRIDPLTGLAGDKVWLFSGGHDHTVDRSVVNALAGFYESWIAASDLDFETPAEPGHAIPSQDDPADRKSTRLNSSHQKI